MSHKSRTRAPNYLTIVRLAVDEGGTYYIATHPELENCFSDGDTPEEALANLEEVTEMVFEHLKEHHLPIPAPRPIFITPKELGQSAVPSQDLPSASPRLEVIQIPA